MDSTRSAPPAFEVELRERLAANDNHSWGSSAVEPWGNNASARKECRLVLSSHTSALARDIKAVEKAI
jgi:hypothetical protein